MEPANQEEQCLQLQLHTDEAVWMRQIGHLKDWCAQTSSVKVGIPSLVPASLAASSLRLLWLFPNLQQLDITFNSIRSRIEQPVVVACAELLNLTSLRIVGGHLSRQGLDLGVLTSLRRLRTLAVRPQSDDELDGFEDEHLLGAARLTGLSSLSLRASENVTDEGVLALTSLTCLTQLSLVPMGLCVTLEGISALSAAMPSLESLSVGLHESRQVAALKGLQERPSLLQRHRSTSTPIQQQQSTCVPPAPCPPPVSPSIAMVLNSPEVSTSGFFTTLTLVLRQRLVSLRMATVESTDPSFLLAVGTLVHLTELKMGVSMAEGGQPFTCNLAALSSLAQLHTLEFAVTQELRLPLSVKLVSMLALSWPCLRSLSLSIMAKPEVAPEALDLLDNFRHLTSLSLFAPLDYSSDEDPAAITLPVSPRYLPRGLTHLVLECAHLRGQQQQQQGCGGGGTATGGEQDRTSNPQQPLSSPHPFQSQHQLPYMNGSSSNIAQDVSGTEDGSTTPSGPPSCISLDRGPAGASGRRDAARASSGGASAASGVTTVSHASVLPHLEHLELNSCRISDSQLAALLGSATGLRHLELSDVKGITDTAMSALRGLTRLEHLVVRLAGGAGGGGASGGVSHSSLAALSHTGTLRHLEWSLSEPMDQEAVEAALSRVLPALGGLQELYLDVASELRNLRTGRGLAEAEGPNTGGHGRGGSTGSSATTSSWRDRLHQALPLCTVAEQPGIVLYDLWNDRTVQVVGL